MNFRNSHSQKGTDYSDLPYESLDHPLTGVMQNLLNFNFKLYHSHKLLEPPICFPKRSPEITSPDDTTP